MRNHSTKSGSKLIGIAVAALFSMLVLPSVASARFRQVPEIDPAAASGIVSIVVGGLAILADRIRR